MADSMLKRLNSQIFMSNSSFSHSVFKRLVLKTRKNMGLFGKGLKHRINPTDTFTLQLDNGYC